MATQPWKSYHTVFTNSKAGMDGVDKEKVQKVVYEMSKGSRYFENEKRKEAALQQRIQYMHAQATQLNAGDLVNFEKAADRRLADLEVNRDLSRTWMHVDLDAFYAAVETLENPSLTGKAMAVGGVSMICTANYEARRFGVRAAMPGFIARRLCPDLIFIPPNFNNYSKYSERVRQVFSEYDAHFLSKSMDEAYLDISELCVQRGMIAGEVAEELRRRVHEETGLTCSAGIGPNRLIAKVCSDINKPNGQFVLPNEQEAVMDFISTLPIRKVSGIGKVTENLLKEVLGINTCKDLIEKRALIFALFSSISADFFLSVGLGIGGSDSPEEEPRKSLSCERTFSAISSESDLLKKLDELADTLSRDLEEHGLCGRTLTLKLKTTSFEVRTRSLSSPSWICSKVDIFCQASKLLKAEFPLALRLMGLRISHFKSEFLDPTQRTLSFVLGSSSRASKISPSKRDDLGEMHPCDDDGGDQENLLQSKELSALMQYGCKELDVGIMQAAQTGVCSSSRDLELQESLVPAVELQMNSSLLDQNHSPHCMCAMNNQRHTTQCPEGKGPSVKLSCIPDVLSGPLDLDNQQVLPQQKSDLVCKTQKDATEASSFESRFFDAMTWVDGSYCSFCGLELPDSFQYERQEHTDFHYAQMLQQEYNGEQGKFSNGVKWHQGGTTQRFPIKKALQQRGRVMKVDSSRKKSKHVPLDVFFSSSRS